MKLQDIEKKFPPFDKPSGEAAYLLETGKFIRYQEPTTPETKPNLQWAAKRGARVDDYEYPPSVYYNCSKCGSKGEISGPNTTAHLVRHCGLVEPVPAEVAARFKKLRENYLSRSKKKNLMPVPGGNLALDKQRDAAVAKALGYKPREILIAESMAAASASVKTQGA
jgi:hypothetical protein